jgi:hypothetical protein
MLPALVDVPKAARYDGIPLREEVLVVRFVSTLFLISGVALAGSKPEPPSKIDGESLFRARHFKAAARKFEKALLASLFGCGAIQTPAGGERNPVSAKIFRPGVNGGAGVIPRNAVLVSWGYSWEAPFAGENLNGFSGFYEYGLGRRMAAIVTNAHFLDRGPHAGLGDTTAGLKIALNTETRQVPLLAASYSLKQPTADTAFGTGWRDHKVTLYADKSFPRSRVTANYASIWAGGKGGFRQHSVPSIGALTRVHGKWGMALQSYWSTNKDGYGGAIAAATYHPNPDWAIDVGLLRNFGGYGSRIGVIAGVTYFYRGARSR